MCGDLPTTNGQGGGERGEGGGVDGGGATMRARLEGLMLADAGLWAVVKRAEAMG